MPGTTGEHKFKKSDLRSIFAAPTQSYPLRLTTAGIKNRPVPGFDSNLLKSPSRICAECNNQRTQPHDRAWERLSAALRSRNPPLRAGSIVLGNRVFKYDTSREMRNIHLYFVKLFGCHIVEAEIPIDISTFAKSIMTAKSHPNVYLKFGLGTTLPDQPVAGMSDIEILKKDGSCAYGAWFYYVDRIAVMVIYAADGEAREGLAGSWHPRFGSSKLVLSDFK